MKRRIALVTTQTLAIYGFAGWVYIAIVALVEPDTLRCGSLTLHLIRVKIHLVKYVS